MTTKTVFSPSGDFLKLLTPVVRMGMTTDDCSLKTFEEALLTPVVRMGMTTFTISSEF